VRSATCRMSIGDVLDRIWVVVLGETRPYKAIAIAILRNKSQYHINRKMRSTEQTLAEISCLLTEEFKNLMQTEFHNVLQRYCLSHLLHCLLFNDPNNIYADHSDPQS
jgi:hypothetical protein